MNINDKLWNTIKKGDIDKANEFVDMGATLDDYALRDAAEDGDMELVETLLYINYIWPYPNEVVLYGACIEGHTKLAKLLHFNYGMYITYECNLSSAFGINDLELAKFMLDDLCFDPNDHSDDAIIYAAENGCLEIVKLLLQDGRTDPAVYNNDPIKIAYKKGHYDIVKLLKNDPRVDSSVINPYD